MLDIIFCNVPYVNIDYVYGAPAILRGVVQNHGYTAKTKDLGVDLYKICDKNIELFYRIQQFFEKVGTVSTPQINAMFDNAIDFFKKNPSRFIGISVMTYKSQYACYLLIKKIREAGINSQIVIGGRGIEQKCVFSHLLNLNAIQKSNKFGILLKELGIADHAVLGDGEDAILKILSGEEFATSQIFHEEISKYPIPDYTDYDFNSYHFVDGETIWPIIGSRGCVRNCDFCDVRKTFGKYQYRSGTDIAEEMLYLNKTIGAKKFGFTDSLVNGGFKPFIEFMEIIAEHNDNNPDNKINWKGDYICRPSDQVPKKVYDLLKRSGACNLIIGAESGSNQVLEHMNKKTTVEGLFDELENFRQHNITCRLLLMAGHWSETHEDFLKHLDMIVKLTPYVRSGVVQSIRIGAPVTILPDTPSDENADVNGIVKFFENNQANPFIQFCKNNPNNTISEKIYRQLTTIKLARRLGISHKTLLASDLTTSIMVVSDPEKINNFYEPFFKRV
jgi:hypothetical protein